MTFTIKPKPGLPDDTQLTNQASIVFDENPPILTPTATNVIGLPTTGSGDANGDGQVNAQDVFYLINFLFAGGPPSTGSGDVNGDGQLNVSDVFYLINYLFAGGPEPV